MLLSNEMLGCQYLAFMRQPITTVLDALFRLAEVQQLAKVKNQQSILPKN